MRKLLRLAVAAGTVALVGSIAAPAGAAPPAGYGFDDKPHVIVAGGSDTTFRAMVGLADLWQVSGLNGCPHSTGVGTAQNSCQADITTNLANYQGDTIANANPVGSGGGIGALNGNGGATGQQFGTVNPIPASRQDATGIVVTSGSPTVTDPAITVADEGKSVRGSGIPNNAYVGIGTVSGTNFGLSSAPNVNLPVNAAASATATLTIGAYACVNSTTGPNPDFARSSRPENTTGGSTPCGNELLADTFWGYAQDGVSVIGFNNHGQMLNGLTAGLSANTLAKIWGCTGGTGTGGRMRWSDVIPGLTPGGPDDADIVPWKMNTASGTYATFRDYVRNNTSPAQPGFDPNAGSCTRQLATAGLPLENDIKPLINDPATLGTGTSADNPENWMWWGSFGVFSAFPFTSAFTRGTAWQSKSAAIDNGTGTGLLPGLNSILNLTYPISRTLFHVTRKADADCVKAAGSTTTCDFTNNPGPALPTSGNDLNVTGGTGGTSGAVREFTRFLCRVSNTQQGTDPFTGANFGSEITTAINNAGFTVIKSAAPSPRTPGSRCKVDS